LRVSTLEQGRSGLGLAAQRFDIEAFAKREGLCIQSWYQDIQTGAGADPLSLRPGLAAALQQARVLRCPLIVSRLDRLSRNVHFITGLMEHKVHFVVAALGRDVDDFTLHIYASLAEQERQTISERIRGALARSQKPLGLRSPSKCTPAFRRRLRTRGKAGIRKAAFERAEAYRVHIEWALASCGRWGHPISFNGAAARLNEQRLPSPRGGRWWGSTVRDMAIRPGFAPRMAYVPLTVLEACVHGLWKRHPPMDGAATHRTLEAGIRRRRRAGVGGGEARSGIGGEDALGAAARGLAGGSVHRDTIAHRRALEATPRDVRKRSDR
jgi:DNA invertase Pin-like site-specific DNA recombinase